MVTRALIAMSVLAAACSYHAGFRDCEVSCAAGTCPDGLTCGGEGLCRLAGATGSCTTVLADANADGAGVGADAPVIDAPVDGSLISIKQVGTITGVKGALFGDAVAISDDGKTIAVGAPATSGNLGAAYVYTGSGSSWTQVAMIYSPTNTLGSSVALSSDGLTAAAGAPTGTTNTVALWKSTGGTWGSGTVMDQGSNQEYGDSVALSEHGDELAIGAPTTSSNLGAVYVSDPPGPQTNPIAMTSESSFFGVSVSLSDDGNTLAVGESEYKTGNGFVYTKSAGQWSSTPVKLAAQYPDNGDHWGQSVAISGDGRTIAMAAPDEAGETLADGGLDNDAIDAGAVDVFASDGGAWDDRTYVKPDVINAGNAFGSCVGFSDDGKTMVVGSRWEQGPSTVIDQGQTLVTGHTVPQAGAAYVFTRSGDNTWTQLHYLKWSNTAENDALGTSCAISGDGLTVVVGVPGASAVVIFQGQ